MLKWFKKIYQRIFITIGLALSRTENEILKADYRNLSPTQEKQTRWYSRFSFLQNFAQGQRDEKYVQDFYEILKKTEEFLQSADEHKMRVAADKHSKSFGSEDYQFWGYFDPKHKFAGKTFKEVESLLVLEKKLIKDDYELVNIVNNKPIENTNSFVDKEGKLITRDEIYKQKLQLEFPLKVFRNNDKIHNKIERLTEVLQVKHIGMGVYRLEFIIPIKFKTNTISDESDIFYELMDVDEVYFNDNFGNLISYKIRVYKERIIIKKENIEFYEVFVFYGEKMNLLK